MSENERAPAAPAGAEASSMTAGQMLRAAREQHGMPLATLASAIKVAPQKLEALEADRLEALPDATFARALAKAVCRFLKVDPQPVLAKLPDVRMAELEHVAQGLNQPFRDGTRRQEFFKPAELLRRPVVLLSVLLVVAALVLWSLPAGMLQSEAGSEAEVDETATVPPDLVPAPVVPIEPLATDPSASAVLPAVPAVPPVEAVPALPPAAAPAASAAVPAAAPASAAPAAQDASAAEAVVVRTSAPSWVEVRDADGKTLLSRQLAAGETAALSGRFPMRLLVGNVSGTEVTVRGQPLDLRAQARNNIARLEIK